MPRPLKPTDSVAEKLKKLPGNPGCYIFKDENGSVLYVGKAVVLKNRVRSYFHQSTKHAMRIARMVARVRDLEWIVVDSEVEALVLECNLIKQHRPPYNVLLRDDKSYPYVVITKEKFPRVLFTRRVRKDGSKYFGPYTSAYTVRETLQILHKAFQLIPCGKSWSGEPVQRPCLYHHLGQCMAPCAGMADRKAYQVVLDQVTQVLSGKGEALISKLRSDMSDMSDRMDFERAAEVRDQIVAIESMMQKQKVLDTDQIDRDVVAVVKDERGSAIQMLYVRGGKLIGQRQFFLDRSTEASPTEAVQEFVKQYYADAPEVPREILLPVEIEERKIVEAFLRNKKGSAVRIEVPGGGEGLALVEMAAANAEQALSAMASEIKQQEQWAEEAIVELQEALGLPTPAERVEGYDISNIQGTAPVGSMVVAIHGTAAKAEYRRFRIKWSPESPNDFAMMKEVILRRLRAYLDGQPKFATLPDLIMIDGGKGQLSAALEARDSLGLTVPMVGLAKKMELLYVPEDFLQPHSDISDLSSASALSDPSDPSDTSDSAKAPKQLRFREIELPLMSPGLVLLRRLRDEAHRFAVSFHRKVRDKRLSASAIEEIPGIGPRRKRLLLRTFGSLEGVRRATVEEIASVPTMTQRLAEQVKEFLAEA
ncbi:MAG: excinuclease ABC subunit UvrC [Armatimonadetes bacterium]|nr:excinuclease ABC subunit UvrC [Armatimonadota bacterium]